MRTYPIEERLEWRRRVTPGPLRQKPIHRWFVFPHSFTSELVQGLIDEWGLTEKDKILDPFVGAGTTVLTAKQAGIPATGYDLSPLSVFVSQVKLRCYNKDRLTTVGAKLVRKVEKYKWNGIKREYPDLVCNALPGKILSAFDTARLLIDSLDCKQFEKDFFRLALLRTIPHFSRAIATGGWLKWVENRRNVRSFSSEFDFRVQEMLSDIDCKKFGKNKSDWKVGIADARKLPELEKQFSAVITSPPYPNRHDYTRVFGVELMFDFLDWHGVRDLRYQSFESHPEARPDRPNISDYIPVAKLNRTIDKVESAGHDERIPKLLLGYFKDIFMILKEMVRVCQPGARVGIVLGNAQYNGIPILVDEITAEIGEKVGLKCTELTALRYRGNSAQQMRVFGRKTARESVIRFQVKK